MTRTISTIWRLASERSSIERARVDVADARAREDRVRLPRPSGARSMRPRRPRGSRRMSRFSATVIHGRRVSSWNTVHTPSACARSGPFISTALPRTRISPASGRSRPPRSLISVLLPAPFSPTRACTSPRTAEKEAPSSARTPPNDLESLDPSTAVRRRFALRFGRRPHVVAEGRLTSSLPWQGLPSVAASAHSVRIGWGPLSVKSSKKLSGRSGNTVSPTLTVSLVT